MDWGSFAGVGEGISQGISNVQNMGAIQSQQDQNALTKIQVQQAQEKQQQEEKYVALPDNLTEDKAILSNIQDKLKMNGSEPKIIENKVYYKSKDLKRGFEQFTTDHEWQKQIAGIRLNNSAKEQMQAEFELKKLEEKVAADKAAGKNNTVDPAKLEEARNKYKSASEQVSNLLKMPEDIDKARGLQEKNRWIVDNAEYLKENKDLAVMIQSTQNLQDITKVVTDYEKIKRDLTKAGMKETAANKRNENTVNATKYAANANAASRVQAAREGKEGKQDTKIAKDVKVETDKLYKDFGNNPFIHGKAKSVFDKEVASGKSPSDAVISATAFGKSYKKSIQLLEKFGDPKKLGKAKVAELLKAQKVDKEVYFQAYTDVVSKQGN